MSGPINAFIVEYQGVIAIIICVVLAVIVGTMKHKVVTKAPDNVIKITISSDQLK